MSSKVIHGDAALELQKLPENSVDALVTDPPAGIGFMGKDWDENKGGRDAWVAWLSGIMTEALRVLKPGAHGLVWAIPRTSHWTATALENAGFEIRDVITHHFGTGFPKSLDVSKALDKKAGAAREVTGPYRVPETGQALSTYNNLQHEDMQEGTQERRNPMVTIPTTEVARQWSGWGTALKPASEHWILVRKPLIGTVAENVEAYGTGGINIDGCRIASGGEHFRSHVKGRSGGMNSADDRSAVGQGMFAPDKEFQPTNSPLGRWPANLILSHSEDCTETECALDCPIRELDAQSGELKSGAWNGKRKAPKTKNSYGDFTPQDETPTVGSSGGASRFFYCSKPSSTERDAGLPSKDKGSANTHPTVKSIDLMRYLCRMVAPPKGTVLDPFTGSGSTGCAAVLEGFEFLGIEAEEAYAEIARKRIEHWAPPTPCTDMWEGLEEEP